jgi:hypothetical protein
VKDTDLYLGQKLYLADVVDVGDGKVEDRILVTEYSVSKAGKEFFELKSRRGKLGGAYRNMGDTLSRLEASPAAAVDRLEKARIHRIALHKERFERDVARTNSDLKLIAEWRNLHAL